MANSPLMQLDPRIFPGKYQSGRQKGFKLFDNFKWRPIFSEKASKWMLKFLSLFGMSMGANFVRIFARFYLLESFFSTLIF